MARKEENKFPILPIVLIIAILTALLFINTDLGSNKNVPVKDIAIDEKEKEMILKYEEGPVRLFFTGYGAKVLVDKKTDLVEVELLGVGNILVLCNKIHNPEIRNTGLQTSVEYRSC